MANQNTQNTTIVVPTQADLTASQPIGTNYPDMVAAARKGDKVILDDLLTRLGDEWASTRKWMQDSRNKNKASTRYTSEQYAALVTRLKSIKGSRQVEPRSWDMLEDHSILTQPYMGRFSSYDLIQLTTGRRNVTQNTWLRGMQSLSFLPDYGNLTSHDKGWQLSLNGKDIQMTAEQVFQLMLHMDRKSVQPLPYSYRCVMDGHRMTNQTPDGVSVIIPAGVTFTDKDNILHTLYETTRLSMTHTRFKWLMHPVANFRYGQDDEEGNLRKLADIVLGCLGEHRIPANDYEVEYCQVTSWFPYVAEERKLEFLRPGRHLSGHHLEIMNEQGKVTEPSDFQSLETYIASRKRIKLERATEAARRAAAESNVPQAKTLQPQVEEVDPFLPDYDLMDDIA